MLCLALLTLALCRAGASWPVCAGGGGAGPAAGLAGQGLVGAWWAGGAAGLRAVEDETRWAGGSTEER